MGKLKGTELEVFMEGLEEPFLVRADQRDFAAWEARPEADTTGATVMLRFLAWNAGKRQGKVSVDWPTFNERLCIQALAPGDRLEEESEDEQGLDPGPKVAGGI